MEGLRAKRGLDPYRKGGFARRIGLGHRPGLLNIATSWICVDPACSQCAQEMPKMIAAPATLTEAQSLN